MSTESFLLVALAVAVWVSPWLRWRLRGGHPGTGPAAAVLLLRGGAVLCLLFLGLQGGILQYRSSEAPRLQLDVLVDVSQSVVDGGHGGRLDAYLEDVKATVDRLASGAVDVRYYPFAGSVQQLRPGEDIVKADPVRLGPESTDIAGAIEHAILAPDDQRRRAILLISDGWSSRAWRPYPIDEARALRLAGGGKMPFLVIPAAPKENWWASSDLLPRFQNVWINTEAAQSDVSVGLSLLSPFSTRPTQGHLSVHVDGERLPLTGARCANRELGRTNAIIRPPTGRDGPDSFPCVPISVVHPMQATQQGGAAPTSAGEQHQLTLSLSPEPSDHEPITVLPAGSVSLSRFFPSRSAIRALVVDGTGEPPPFLSGLLGGPAWAVDFQKPQELTASLDFARYDLIILNDLGPVRLGQEREEICRRIAAYVRAGGGLVVAGGPESFGHDGYGGTSLAEVLPVDVTPKGSSGGPPMTVVVVLDLSSGLYFDKPTFQRAVDYALRSISPLNADSRVRVMGFHETAEELVPLQRFGDVGTFEEKLRSALAAFDDQVQARVRRGLAPTGINLYRALRAAGASFPELPSSRTTPEHNRVLIISNSLDLNRGRMQDWWVENGRFRSETAAHLAAELRSKRDVVINAIGMVSGPGPLKLESDDPLEGKRKLDAIPGRRLLDEIASSSQGNAYSDTYGIPLGEVSRPMIDHAATGVPVRLNERHPFIEGLWEPDRPGPTIDGYTVLSAKHGAEIVMSMIHELETQPPHEVALWADWLLARQPRMEDGGTVGMASFGGRVVAFTTSLRDVHPAPQQASAFLASWQRALAWTRRDRPRDILTVDGGRTSEGVLLRVALDSIDATTVRRVTAAKSGEKERLAFQRDGMGKWLGTVPGNGDAARPIDLQAEVVRAEGRLDIVSERVWVSPATLAPVGEKGSFLPGPNRGFLASLAEVSDGKVLDWSAEALPNGLMPDVEPVERLRKINLRWLVIFCSAPLWSPNFWSVRPWMRKWLHDAFVPVVCRACPDVRPRDCGAGVGLRTQ